MEEKNPKVFISYSQDSVDFADKVLNFSNKLRQEGIDAILDQYEEAPPEGWPRWMETNIEESDYVLIIGSSGYLDKTTGKVGLGVGRGVKWESNLIYQKLYESDTLNPKFIPVVFDNDDLKFIPLPLRGSTYYNVSSDKGFDKLYWRLRGVSTKQKPPLGKLRPLPEKERKTLYVTSMIDIDTWDKATWRGAAFFMFEDEPPILLLPFINEEYAKKIFEDWISIVGTEDKNNDIRVALVTLPLSSLFIANARTAIIAPARHIIEPTNTLEPRSIFLFLISSVTPCLVTAVYTTNDIMIANSSALLRTKSAICVELLPANNPRPTTSGPGELIMIDQRSVFAPDFLSFIALTPKNHHQRYNYRHSCCWAYNGVKSVLCTQLGERAHKCRKNSDTQTHRDRDTTSDKQNSKYRYKSAHKHS